MLTVTSPNTVDWENMPLDEMAYGNAIDCDLTKRCGDLMVDELDYLGCLDLYENCLSLILPIMAEVENKGLLVDTDELNDIGSLLETEIERIEDKMFNILPKGSFEKGEVNFASPKQLGEIMFSSKGLKMTPRMWSEKTGEPSTSEAHIKDLSKDLRRDKKANESRIEFLDCLLEYRKRVKQFKTYVNGIKSALEYNGDGRVYSQYNFATVVTGRLSCSAPQVKKRVEGKRGKVNKVFKKGVSFHTLPRPDEEGKDRVNIRDMFIADKGYTFLAADYSAAELRVLAHVSQEPNLIQAFKSGEDLHKYTASLVYGKTIDKITKKERQIAKSVSFLIVYGGGPEKLADQVGISIEEAKDVFFKFFKAYPGIKFWMEATAASIREKKYSESIFGRRRHLPNVDSPNNKLKHQAIRQGINFIIQSSASDIMLHGILSLYARSRKIGLEILATVHDSIEAQIPHEKISEAAEIMRSSLSDTSIFKKLYDIDFAVPMAVDVEIGSSFGDVKEAHFDEKGNLTNAQELSEYVQTKANSRSY